MKKIFIAVFLVLTGLTSAANSYAENKIFLGGRVTSLGKGVEGIEVNVNGTNYKTNSDGYYKTVPADTDSTYIIKINDKRFHSVPEFIREENITESKNNLDFTVSGEVSGKVTFRGRPLANAEIKINDRKQKYITDIDGNYKIFNVGLNKEYIVSAAIKGYSFEPKQVTLTTAVPEEEINTVVITEINEQNQKNSKTKNMKNSEQETTAEEKLVPENVLNFKADVQKCSVTIMVKQGLEPLANADITMNNKYKYKTDEYGVCTIENLIYDRKYIFKAEKNGITFIKRIQKIERLLSDETITFDAYLNISGRVTLNNEAFPNAIIECGGRMAKTDKDGKYSFDNLEPNEQYTIKAVSSFFDFYPAGIVIDNLINSQKDKNFMVKPSPEETDALFNKEKKIAVQKEKNAKIAAQKKEAAKIEKEEKAKLKEAVEKIKKSEKEEDLKIKNELIEEDIRVKELELIEKKEENEFLQQQSTAALRQNINALNKVSEKNEDTSEIQTEQENKIKNENSEDNLSIEGRVLKNKNGVEGVQILLLMQTETKKFVTDKNGFFTITDLEKNKNYLITVMNDKKTQNLSPKSRVYKNLTKSLINQNFYIVENFSGGKYSAVKYFSDKNKKNEEK